MTDAFARLIGPIVQHVLEFQRELSRGDHPGLDAERQELLALFDEAEQKAAAHRELADAFALARHALVYWIDEVLINSGWQHAAAWREHILEWDFYRERLGGERFFERARDAESRAGVDALEAYFLCVALGFRGQYAQSPRELLGWSERVTRRIAEAGGNPECSLPDDPGDRGRGPLQPLPGPSILLTVAVLASASLLASLVCFILVAELTG